MEDVLGSPAPTVSMVELGDELSVFDSATGTALTLNRTARDVFALADGHTTVSEAVDVLARAYGVDADLIRDDVVRAAEGLAEAGVLVPSDR